MIENSFTNNTVEDKENIDIDINERCEHFKKSCNINHTNCNFCIMQQQLPSISYAFQHSNTKRKHSPPSCLKLPPVVQANNSDSSSSDDEIKDLCQRSTSLQNDFEIKTCRMLKHRKKILCLQPDDVGPARPSLNFEKMQQVMCYPFNVWCPIKRSYILKQTWIFQLQVCLSIFDLFVDTRHLRIITSFRKLFKINGKF